MRSSYTANIAADSSNDRKHFLQRFVARWESIQSAVLLNVPLHMETNLKERVLERIHSDLTAVQRNPIDGRFEFHRVCNLRGSGKSSKCGAKVARTED